MTLAQTFRARLREIRKRENLSQEGLGHLAGYDPSYIANIERGAHTNPSLAFIAAVAGALRCHPSELLQ